MLVPVAAPDRARSGYRADIQGLRGFAIVLVVAYHLWTSGRVSGGVDVFLFISAFLMVGSYARKGTAFRLVSFLIQRFRRLVPGAAVVIAVTLFVGWIVLPPTRYGSFLAHGQASLFYYENWQMIADSVDYISRQLVGDGYLRMQTDLAIGLDETDDTSATNIAALQQLAAGYLRRPSTRRALDAMARRL